MGGWSWQGGPNLDYWIWEVRMVGSGLSSRDSSQAESPPSAAQTSPARWILTPTGANLIWSTPPLAFCRLHCEDWRGIGPGKAVLRACTRHRRWRTWTLQVVLCLKSERKEPSFTPRRAGTIFSSNQEDVLQRLWPTAHKFNIEFVFSELNLKQHKCVKKRYSFFPLFTGSYQNDGFDR